jgi:hypothetical protein
LRPDISCKEKENVSRLIGFFTGSRGRSCTEMVVNLGPYVPTVILDILSVSQENLFNWWSGRESWLRESRWRLLCAWRIIFWV